MAGTQPNGEGPMSVADILRLAAESSDGEGALGACAQYLQPACYCASLVCAAVQCLTPCRSSLACKASSVLEGRPAELA